jgi:hypothetical protein
LSATLPADEEWRVEWSKFYYGLDLAAAFAATRDPIFQDTWRSLVSSWIDQVPVALDSTDVTARRLQNWIYAWLQFAASEAFVAFDDEFVQALLSSITAQVQHVRRNLTKERNHRTLELYSLFIAALALPEIENSNELLEFSMRELYRNLLEDILPDGVHREQSSHYHMVALRSFLGARFNAEQFDLKFPEAFDAHLEKACEFAMHLHRPDGSIPALSDADTGSYLDLLVLAASIFSRDDFLYVGTRGLEGTPPAVRNASFPFGGYFLQRSGWGKESTPYTNERQLIFDCGPLGDGGHGHYDALSIDVAANGHTLIVDPGRYTYHEDTFNWRQRFKGTAAHNTVCIDGLDQTPYFCGKPKSRIAEATLIERLTNPAFDVLCGQVRSPGYEAIHKRFVFFIGGQYWVIADYVRGTQPHDVNLRFHLAPEAMNRIYVDSNPENSVVHSPICQLIFPHDSKPSIEPGWYAPTYGKKKALPVVSVHQINVVQANFLTVILPHSKQTSSAKLVVHENSDERIRCDVEHMAKGVSDHLVWSKEIRVMDFGRMRANARAAWWRTDSSGQVSTFRGCGVHRISVSDSEINLNAGTRPFEWVSWDKVNGFTHDRGMQRC